MHFKKQGDMMGIMGNSFVFSQKHRRCYDYSVYIGRFQPFHNGHLETCKQSLQYSNHLIILIGSAFFAPNIRNPFTFEERRMMIEVALREEGLKSFTLLPIRDYLYDDEAWTGDVRKKVSMITNPSSKITLIGFDKDFTSNYLRSFPKWNFIKMSKYKNIDAHLIRDQYFTGLDWQSNCPDSVISLLTLFVKTKKWKWLVSEYQAIVTYKKAWGPPPYPPIHVTADIVLVCNAHILLVKRGKQPGKGLYALPGGFVNENEKIEVCCLRELQEETKIQIPPSVLKKSIKSCKVFDHPLRSDRGRVITHAFYLELKEETCLPQTKGNDDAKTTLWLPVQKLSEYMECFFEDHFIIIEHFLGRYNGSY